MPNWCAMRLQEKLREIFRKWLVTPELYFIDAGCCRPSLLSRTVAKDGHETLVSKERVTTTIRDWFVPHLRCSEFPSYPSRAGLLLSRLRRFGFVVFDLESFHGNSPLVIGRSCWEFLICELQCSAG